jgi:2-oxo-4-hydroxy-4-carboxy-5-ureidoimidazoline decarboxylase
MSKTLSELNGCSKDDFVAALANIFEYSPWIAEHAAAGRHCRHQKVVRGDKAAVDRACRIASGADHAS